MIPYLNVAQMLVSALLIVLILMQSRGTGFDTGYSSDSSIFRTRRGVERTLFHLTIAVGVIFLMLAIAVAVAPRFET